MSERGKKIAKWCWIILGVCVVVGLFLCVVNESILFYCLRHIKDSILILLCCLLLSLLYFKRYKWVCGLLLYFAIFVIFYVNLDYSCGDAPLALFLVPFIAVLPFFMVFYVIRAIKGIITKKKIITKQDTIILLFLCVCPVLFLVMVNIAMNGCRAGKQATVDFEKEMLEDTVATEDEEMLKQVQHEKVSGRFFTQSNDGKGGRK